jgi:hypothetical protein
MMSPEESFSLARNDLGIDGFHTEIEIEQSGRFADDLIVGNRVS